MLNRFLEAFNVLNHKNDGNPVFGFSQGANTSAATVVTGTPNATAGQIDSIVGTCGRSNWARS